MKLNNWHLVNTTKLNTLIIKLYECDLITFFICLYEFYNLFIYKFKERKKITKIVHELVT